MVVLMSSNPLLKVLGASEAICIFQHAEADLGCNRHCDKGLIICGVSNYMLMRLSSILQDIRPKKGGPPVGPQLITRGDVPKVPYEGSLPLMKNPCCH